MARSFAAVILLVAFSAPAQAADLSRIDITTVHDPTPSFVSELRFGGSAQDPGGPEQGTANVTGAVVFAKPFRSADPIVDFLLPRPMIGGSWNTGGRTSFAYAALAWTYDISPHVFVEATFGGAIHNGDTSTPVPPHHDSLGCSPLFRESAAVGYRFDVHWSVMAMVEHMSNAGLCSSNRGLTNVGAQLAYHF